LDHDVNRGQSKRLFQYEIMWEREPSLADAIDDAWKMGNQVSDLGDVVTNLHGVMISLKHWSRKTSEL
jgi:hypothetical protein